MARIIVHSATLGEPERLPGSSDSPWYSSKFMFETMQLEFLISTASIIVTFIVATWRWSASQNKRFDQINQRIQNEVSKLRDDNNRLRSEVRGDIKEVREEIKEVREDVHRLDKRIARQEGLIRALWANTLKGDPASEPAFPE